MTRPFAAARLLAALILAAAAPWPARAQSFDWQDISGPSGYSQVYELGNGTLFGREENLLVRSFDGGRTWQNFARPGGPILEFDARGPAAVIAINRSQATSNKQFYVSYDDGNTWTRFWAEPSTPATAHASLMLAADGTPYTLVQVVAKMAVERFVDGAWQRMGVPSGVYIPMSNVTYTLSAVGPDGAIYIGTAADGIHSTRDGGQTWTKALPYRLVDDIAFAVDGRVAIATRPNGRTAGGMFVSTDRGLTWTLTGLTDLPVFGIGYNPAGDLLALGSRGSTTATTVFRLDAGAAAWDSLEAFRFYYTVFHAAGSGRLIAASTEVGLSVSDDDGASWHTDGVRSQDLYSVAPAPDGSVLAGTIGNGIYRTTDDGERWERMGDGDTPEYFYTLLHADTVVFAGTEQGLFASRDSGRTWSPRTGALTPGGTELAVYTVSAGDGPRILIGTAAGVYRSVDRGLTWHQSGLGASTVNGLAVAPSGSVWAVTGQDGVWESTDGGQGWQGRGLVVPGLQTVAVNGNGQVVVGAAAGVYVSDNGGLTWNRKIFTDGHVHSILFNGNFGMFAGSSAGLFVSNDAGRSWASAGLDGFFVVALAYSSSMAIDAVIYKGGVARSLQVVTAVDSDPAAVPEVASLAQNYPNPFNPSTTIGYAVPSRSRVRLRVFDVLGREVALLADGVVPAGSYESSWHADGRPSGVYFCELTIMPEAGDGAAAQPFSEIRKMLLLR